MCKSISTYCWHQVLGVFPETCTFPLNLHSLNLLISVPVCINVYKLVPDQHKNVASIILHSKSWNLSEVTWELSHYQVCMYMLVQWMYIGKAGRVMQCTFLGGVLLEGGSKQKRTLWAKPLRQEAKNATSKSGNKRFVRHKRHGWGKSTLVTDLSPHYFFIKIWLYMYNFCSHNFCT